MKRAALFRNPTTALWLLNALGVLLVVSAVTYRIGSSFLGVGASLPKIEAISAQPIQQLAAIPGAGSRNPFDSASVHWGGAPPGESKAPELRGIIRLPGVSAAVTGAGIVYLGGQVSGGRLAQITQDGLVVQQENQTREIKLHVAPRPTLQTLNKAQPSASKEKK